MKDSRLANWEIKGDVVELTYDDGDVIKVTKKDFDRAFGPIVSASKEAVMKEFAI